MDDVVAHARRKAFCNEHDEAGSNLLLGRWLIWLESSSISAALTLILPRFALESCGYQTLSWSNSRRPMVDRCISRERSNNSSAFSPHSLFSLAFAIGWEAHVPLLQQSRYLSRETPRHHPARGLFHPWYAALSLH